MNVPNGAQVGTSGLDRRDTVDRMTHLPTAVGNASHTFIPVIAWEELPHSGAAWAYCADPHRVGRFYVTTSWGVILDDVRLSDHNAIADAMLTHLGARFVGMVTR